MDKKDSSLAVLEKERLKYTMSRIDHYYGSVNNKSAVYIAINTFVTGGIIILISRTEALNNLWELAYWSLGACLFFGILSLVTVAYNGIPFFSTKPNSLYYFGSIGAKTLKEFCLLSVEYTLEQELEDLRGQIHILSQGLTKKFKNLKFVGALLIVQFILLVPTIYYLIQNL